MTVADAIEEFLADVKAGKSVKTYLARKRMLALFQESCTKQFDQITEVLPAVHSFPPRRYDSAKGARTVSTFLQAERLPSRPIFSSLALLVNSITRAVTVHASPTQGLSRPAKRTTNWSGNTFCGRDAARARSHTLSGVTWTSRRTCSICNRNRPNWKKKVREDRSFRSEQPMERLAHAMARPRPR